MTEPSPGIAEPGQETLTGAEQVDRLRNVALASPVLPDDSGPGSDAKPQVTVRPPVIKVGGTYDDEAAEMEESFSMAAATTQEIGAVSGHVPAGGARLDARGISAWFGSAKVLQRVSLTMEPKTVTALIGPSGCGKSTFLRTLNRMHELIPSAALAGEVFLNGEDIYAPGRRITETRKRIRHGVPEAQPVPGHDHRSERRRGAQARGHQSKRVREGRAH